MARKFLDSLKQAPETLEALNQLPDLPSKTREQIRNNRTQSVRNQQHGAAVVIANQYCGFKRDIASPQHDLNLMVGALSRLDFDIVHKSMDRSDSKWKVVEMIKDISLLKLEDHLCFLFYYSGHADVTGILAPDGHVISYANIIQRAEECESLAEKPKIFIFDCSRTALNKEVVGKEKELDNSSLPSNCLVVFSTSCGGHAFADRTSGSFFTQDLVKAVQHFCSSGQSHRDLQGVLDEVSRGVREYVPKRSKGQYRQEPVICSSLEKPITLSDLGNWSDDIDNL